MRQAGFSDLLRRLSSGLQVEEAAWLTMAHRTSTDGECLLQET
jgi:hypothetical protein